jgi:hypothetical protein
MSNLTPPVCPSHRQGQAVAVVKRSVLAHINRNNKPTPHIRSKIDSTKSRLAILGRLQWFAPNHSTQKHTHPCSRHISPFHPHILHLCLFHSLSFALSLRFAIRIVSSANRSVVRLLPIISSHPISVSPHNITSIHPLLVSVSVLEGFRGLVVVAGSSRQAECAGQSAVRCAGSVV